MTSPSRPGPLAGLKVVSMAEQYPGPLCTMIFSDMGADVIQVERPGTGDPSRIFTSFFEAVNRGKRSIAVDVRDEAQRAKLIELLADADVFIEGFRPGKIEKQGLGYAALSAVNPGLIYCSISGYGQTGPYRDRPGHDISIQGVAGALEERITGDVTGLPPALLLGDNASALYAAIGILAALQGRNRTGRGTYVDIAMSDSVTSLLTAFVGMVGDTTQPPPQAEPGYDMFRCADGRYLTLSIAHEDRYWDMLCDTLELPALKGLPRSTRTADRAGFGRRIAEAIARHDLAHWAEIFEATGQMWGPVNALDQLPDDPQIQARELLARLTRADGGEQWVVRQPVRFSEYDNAPLIRAPRLAEHDGSGF